MNTPNVETSQQSQTVMTEHPRSEIQRSIQIESATNTGFLDSKFIKYLDELSSRFYFFIDKYVVTKGNYDINNDNGFFLNSLFHASFKLRKAVPAAKELKQEGLLNLPGILKLIYRYAHSFTDNGRIQCFVDDYHNQYWALNLHLAKPSLSSVSQYLTSSDQHIDIALGTCSKGHLLGEIQGLEEVHVCPYRIEKNCFYTLKNGFVPEIDSPFFPCYQSACLAGHLHKTINGNSHNTTESSWRFFTVLGGFQVFREIPGFFKMNTKDGSPKFLIAGTCKFTVPYLIHIARMFPNVQGLVIAYSKGCETLCDRIVRLRGTRRDQHITRFMNSSAIYSNPISQIHDLTKKD